MIPTTKGLSTSAACLAEAHIGLMKTTSGFGGITRGVIQAASMGGKRRAPVMRLEELHQVPSGEMRCQSSTSRHPSTF